MKRSLVLSVGLLVSLTGCAGHFPGGITGGGITLPEISSTINSELDTIRKFSGEATFTVDSPERSGRVGSAIEILPAQEATIHLQSPFGGVVGKMKLTQEVFILYNQNGELEHVGSPQNPGLPGFPDLSSMDRDLLGILMGVIALPDTIVESAVTVNEKGQFLLSNVKGSHHRNFWVDPRVARVTRYEEYTGNRENRITMEFSDFTLVEGIHLPRSIRVIQHEQNRMFSVYYHKIRIQRYEVSHVSRS